MSDVQDAVSLLRNLIGRGADMGERLVAFVHDGAPASKARACFTRRGFAYTPATTVSAQKALSLRFIQALRGTKFERNVAIVAVFYRPNYQRIDADNLMKLVLDAGTKANAWIDDCYVTAQACKVELDRTRPRTVIALCEAESSMMRGARFTCAQCGQLFDRAGKATVKNPPKTCSVACSVKYRAETRTDARCAKCDASFHRRRSGQRYCSKTCAAADPMRRQKLAEQRPAPTCELCGGRVSRREYLQCAACRGRGRKLKSLVVTEEP